MENNKKLVLILAIGVAVAYFILKPKQASAQTPILPAPPPPPLPLPNPNQNIQEQKYASELISSLVITPNATNITPTSVKLLWKINQTTGVYKYPIYDYIVTNLNTGESYRVGEDGGSVNSDVGHSDGFINLTALKPNTQYSFEIYARDIYKNISPKVVVKLTTPASSTTSGGTSGSGSSGSGSSGSGSGSTSGTSGGSATSGGPATGGDLLDPNNLLDPTAGKATVSQTITISASQPTSNSVNISWSASSPTAVKTFDIYQGDKLVSTVFPNANMIPIAGLLPSTQYTFYVIANNNNGTTSSSGKISITTEAAVTSGGGFVNDTDTTTTSGTTGSYGGGGGGSISTNYDYDIYRDSGTGGFDSPIFNRNYEINL